MIGKWFARAASGGAGAGAQPRPTCVVGNLGMLLRCVLLSHCYMGPAAAAAVFFFLFVLGKTAYPFPLLLLLDFYYYSFLRGTFRLY